jgi:hypothetical protein
MAGKDNTEHMITDLDADSSRLLTRRDVVAGAIKTMFAVSALSLPLLQAEGAAPPRPFRAINIMNFIRAEEPREPMDLFEPVKQQMQLIKAHNFPATWLLQYDALVEGPFVDYLKSEMLPSHEVGIWFEMNRKICDDAGIAWRGNPDWEWDYHVPVAYAIGYTPDERQKLADTAVATFKRIFGKDVKSIASWNLDAITVEHLSDQYGIDAFGNCRDQLATDGFTIWGAPIAGYYPSRNNAWSPALSLKNQINSPMFRLLGQDPQYYYDNVIPYPDTMEPVWDTGRSEIFVDRFLEMIAEAPTQSFGYAQLGQENSFGWAEMVQAYPMQMDKLAKLQSKGHVIVETMGETGRRFKRSFKSTPTQAQVMLQDAFGHTDNPERTVWYQSKFLRANLHFRGSEFYLRDLHVYSDGFPQPYLTDPVRQHGIEQRLLAVLDGYHWSDDHSPSAQPGHRAMGRFVLTGADGTQTRLEMTGIPKCTESAQMLQTEITLASGGTFIATFREREVSFEVFGIPKGSVLALIFEWVPSLSALTNVDSGQLSYKFRDFAYTVNIANARASATADGAAITSSGQGPIRLLMAQKA